MTWRRIPGNPYWEFNDETVNAKYENMNVVAGVRTDGINQIYARVRRVGDPINANRGEIVATFHNANAGVIGVQPSSFYLSQPEATVPFILSNGDAMITADGLTFTVLEQ